MKKLEEASFRCKNKHSFQAEVGRVEDNKDKQHHPFDYYAECPECGEEAVQAHWEVNLMKAHSRATGPITEEGKAKVAGNLDGHSTENTRFNAIKTGLYARVASFFPAKPGRYAECGGCEYLHNVCQSGEGHCLKKTELFMVHDIAFKTNNPKLLQSIRTDMQSVFTAILNDIMRSIIATGVEVRTPRINFNPKSGGYEAVCYTDKHGQEVMVEDITENPLLKRMIDFMQSNSLTLNDMGMTEKAQEESQLSGQLVEQSSINQQSALEFKQQQLDQSQSLIDLINNGRGLEKKVIGVEDVA